MGGGLTGVPLIREEFLKPFNRMGTDSVEEVVQISEWVDLESFAGRDKAGQDGSSSPAVIGAEGYPGPTRPVAVPTSWLEGNSRCHQ